MSEYYCGNNGNFERVEEAEWRDLDTTEIEPDYGICVMTMEPDFVITVDGEV